MFLKNDNFFFAKYSDGKFNSWRRKIIKDIRNLFRLKKELDYTAIKDIRNPFRLERETKAIKGRILTDIKNLFEHEGEKYIF